MSRAARLKRVDAITFHGQLEALVARAAGVVAMGGYNTFCEVLSLDKRALIVPRTAPRLEQHIRASRATELGLVSMLSDDGTHDPANCPNMGTDSGSSGSSSGSSYRGPMSNGFSDLVYRTAR